MTKRQHYTLEEVMDHLSDEDDDYDPDEPMMEGSDDEFSDLEMDERDDYDQLDLETPSSPAALHHSSTLSSAQPNSPTLSGISRSTPSPSGSPPQSQPPSSASSPSGKYIFTFIQKIWH